MGYSFPFNYMKRLGEIKMKKQYKIIITEILERIVTIDAENEFEAKSIAEDMYKDCEIVLSEEDFTGYSIESYKEEA